MTYNFTIMQHGTYWIHSHISGQYPDGLRSPLVIHNPSEPYHYDHDIVITVSDWYHKESKEIIPSYLSGNPSGAAPVPQAALMNDAQNASISFEPLNTYRIRFINVGAFAQFRLWLQDHEMRVIEVDGVYVQESPVSMIMVAPGQRVSVLVTAKDVAETTYALTGSMDTSLFSSIPEGLNPSAPPDMVHALIR